MALWRRRADENSALTQFPRQREISTFLRSHLQYRPDVSNKKFPEAMKHEANGLHTIMWKFSPEDYNQLDQIWNGPHPRTARNWLSATRCRPDFPGPKTPKSRNSVRPARSIQT